MTVDGRRKLRGSWTLIAWLLLILSGGLMTSLAVAGHAEITPNAAAGAPSDTEVFMTLTKTPVKATALPTTAEIIRPEQFESWSPQTAADARQRWSRAVAQARHAGA